jgi:hypothetical protein
MRRGVHTLHADELDPNISASDIRQIGIAINGDQPRPLNHCASWLSFAGAANA